MRAQAHNLLTSNDVSAHRGFSVGRRRNANRHGPDSRRGPIRWDAEPHDPRTSESPVGRRHAIPMQAATRKRVAILFAIRRHNS